GTYTITATDGVNYASTTLTVLHAYITVAPTTYYLGVSDVVVTGAGFEPNTNVNVSIYSSTGLVNSKIVTTSSTGGFSYTFVQNFTASGAYIVNATDGICSPSNYTNDVTVDPRLVVTPSSVIPGEAINVTGYGFTPTYTANVTWIGEGIGYHNLEVLVKNLSINNIGEFSATAKIPSPVYGGVHYVFANDTKNVNASAEVYVNPSITLSPSTASLGSSVTVTLNGLMVGQENWTMTSSNWTGTATLTLGSGSNITDKYLIAQDNIPTYVYNLTGNPYGYATYTISATGYPMLHAIQLVNQTTLPYKLVATAWLNIIGTTNTETALSTQLSGVNASLSNQISSAQSSMSTQLTNLQGTLMNILSSLTSLQTAVGNLGSTLNSDYNSLSSSLSSVSSSLSSMSSTLSSVSSQVGAIGSSLSSMSSTLSSVQSEAAQISSVNSLALATIVIAIIVLVLEIVVLIRRR
ncbi:MAG: hypothetical protein ACP5RJ_08305, partial [Conexivisphaera sp.]